MGGAGAASGSSVGGATALLQPAAAPFFMKRL